MSEQKPELVYASTFDRAERRRLQAETITKFRANIVAVVRRLVPAEHVEEGTQAGLIGLLQALEKFDPGQTTGPLRSAEGRFWHYAFPVIRNEIQQWADRGVWWRKAANRGKSEQRQAARQAAKAQRRFESLDVPASADDETGETRLDMIPGPDDVEAIVAEREGLEVLSTFTDGLVPSDRETILSENSQRVRSRHYLTLVERAKAHVQGSETIGPRAHTGTVRRNPDSVRP